MLILLQAVLGFDNLLYISLESKRAPVNERAKARNWGIGLAVALRIVLLFALVKVMDFFTDPVYTANFSWFTGSFSVENFIVLVGGAFLLYTATKEILHMIAVDDFDADDEDDEPRSTKSVISTIVIMNLVFSFDSILSAKALTDKFWLMALAIIIGGVMMITLADRVSAFLQRNRIYEVLGLFILFIVGIMLLSEGGAGAKMHLFGQPITKMTKTTFYFVITVLVLTDVVQSRYQKKLLNERRSQTK
ncbi:MAG TPA: tellurium resistance protein TerC [Verrucomicrobiales bacterium]|nr:tellurium resistance protein TerC [Verrucomicrobiales bacterium]